MVCQYQDLVQVAAVSIGTATLKAAKDVGFVKDNVPDTSLALDHKKIGRSNQRVMKTCEQKHDKEVKDEDIQSIMVKMVSHTKGRS